VTYLFAGFVVDALKVEAAMSNRTWTCIHCRKSYRRSQSITAVECPTCHEPCEYVHWKIRVPSPKRIKAWDEFWSKYNAEKSLLDAFHRGELRHDVTLELLNMQLHVPVPVTVKRRRTSRCT
jgi:hypothetical protein